jgi:pyruvate formate lyase activating enzyme
MMSELESLDAGRRHHLGAGIPPGAPEDRHLPDETNGAFGYVHSYETASRCDGPGLRFVLFVSGCPLRCSYCHNPDSWHLKDGAPIPAGQVIHRLAGFAPALRALDGGLTISGGDPLVQIAFTRRILSAAKKMGLNAAMKEG